MMRREFAFVLRDEFVPAAPAWRWLTIDEAAAERGCSSAAMRKRVDPRPWLDHHQGGRVYLDREKLERDALARDSGDATLAVGE